jgi:transposase InsO family protein
VYEPATSLTVLTGNIADTFCRVAHNAAMPWKVSAAMDQRLAFVKAFREGKRAKAALCRAFGISRECAYKWLRRYEAKGVDGLKDASRAPVHTPHAMAKSVAQQLIKAREENPNWGPRMLVARLAARHPKVRWPAPSTVGELLKREGLIRPRQSPRRQADGPAPSVTPQRANDVWSADFKGHFPTADGKRCHPLTISDAHSRFLLQCHALPSTHEAPVRKTFERVFNEYGLPLAIRTDNGVPFSGTGGLSKLSVWWVKLGIHLERIEPGRPQQNGRHERIHRTLQDDVGRGPRTMLEHQKAFDRFRADYNYERPHQALAMRTPGSIYRTSKRQLPRKLAPIEYGPGFEIRSIRNNGEMKWRGVRVRVSEALGGERVGLCAIDDGLWAIHFGPLRLGVIDERHRSVYGGA